MLSKLPLMVLMWHTFLSNVSGLLIILGFFFLSSILLLPCCYYHYSHQQQKMHLFSKELCTFIIQILCTRLLHHKNLFPHLWNLWVSWIQGWYECIHARILQDQLSLLTQSIQWVLLDNTWKNEWMREWMNVSSYCWLYAINWKLMKASRVSHLREITLKFG